VKDTSAPVSGRRRASPRYFRGQGIEFDRVANFSDAVFAISMTLLVVGIEVPAVVHAGQLNHAIYELRNQILSFFIAFIVVGYYWLAHHRFFSYLQSVDSVFITLNVAYLAAIAFIPFPVGLLGKYETEPISVIMAASSLGAASLLETVLLYRARRYGMLRKPMSDATFRYSLIASTVPVVVFALSIPIAFVNPTWALYFWAITWPAEVVLGKFFAPPEAADYS